MSNRRTSAETSLIRFRNLLRTPGSMSTLWRGPQAAPSSLDDIKEYDIIPMDTAAFHESKRISSTDVTPLKKHISLQMANDPIVSS